LDWGGASSPASLTNFNGTLYFRANDGTNGYELWKSDGTESGTQSLASIVPSGSVFAPTQLTAVGNAIYYEAVTDEYGVEVYRLVENKQVDLLIAPNSIAENSGANSIIGSLISIDVNVGDSFTYDLVLGAGDTDNAQFFIEGSVLKVLNSLDFETKNTYAIRIRSTDQQGLWIERPINVTVNDINEAPSDISVSSSSIAKNAGANAVVGTFSTTDVDAGNTFTYTLVAGTGDTDNADFNILGNTLRATSNFDFGSKSSYNIRVRATDQDGLFTDKVLKITVTVAPKLVKDINNTPSPLGSNPSQIIGIGSTVFFSAMRPAVGMELWKTDGTETGTVLVKDIRTGAGSSSPANLTNLNGTLYYTADDGTIGRELWKSDGTAVGTVLVKDILAGGGSSSPTIFTNVNGAFYFRVNDGTSGYELWKSDGTSAGTVLVKDIRTGAGSGSPECLTNVNGTLYFCANDGTNGSDLWKFDGTAAGTVMVKDFRTGVASSTIANLTNVNGTLYFQANDGTSGYELWKSDGTSAGTVLVKDILTGVGSSSPANLTNVNGTLYFTANDGPSGSELWKSDGTSPGTVLVTRRGTGAGSSSFTDVNGTLYYTANDGTNGVELWKSDGTWPGTVLVKNIWTGVDSSNPASLTNVNGTLYFSANDSDNGLELWRSNGTAAGTVLVADISAGSRGSYPFNLTNVEGTLYFTAEDDFGRELWRSDGTAAGTVLVKDIRTGTGSSNLVNLANVKGWTLFTAEDAVYGEELWISDGTESGTELWSIDFGIPEEVTQSSGVITVDLSRSSSSRNITIKRQSDGIVIVDNDTNKYLLGGNPLISLPDLRGIRLKGSQFSDSFIVDFTFGFVSLSEAVVIDGRAGGNDSIRFIGFSGTDGRFSNAGSTHTMTMTSSSQSMALSFDNIEEFSAMSLRRISSSEDTLFDFPFTVSSSLPFDLGWTTFLENATVTSSNTISLGSGESVSGTGTIAGRISAEAGSLIHADGNMTLGVESSVAGFLTRGDIEIGSNTLTLLDANQVVLGSLSTLGTATSPGTLIAVNGALIDFGNNLVGFGTLETPNSAFKPTVINGAVQGDSLSKPITLPGYIKGIGTLNNVSITGTYSPGFSPAAVTLGSMSYGSGATTVVELAGTTPGSQYDQLNHLGQAFLGGTIVVTLLNGYLPSVGDSFTILMATDGMAGRFSASQFPALPYDRVWNITYSSNSVLLSVVANNLAPSDILLSNSSVAENIDVNASVGNFSTTDDDAGNTFTYVLIAGSGDSDNDAFVIEGNILKATASFNYEAKNNYSVRVRSTDQGGLFTEKAFTINITDINETPTDIGLSSTNVAEKAGSNAIIGSLTTIDPDAGNTFTYTLVSGIGSTDNSAFNISDSTLRATDSFDFESKSSYTLRIRSTDQEGLFTEKSFAIQVLNIPDATVASRRVFYNRSTSSVFGNGSGNPNNAIDPTKVALLPGQPATIQNYTNYIHGLNGLFVDVAGLQSTPTASDFQFATWNGIATDGFVPTTAVATVTSIPGGGVDGSTRLKIEFDNGAIRNTWLRVTVLATANTDLAINDVFYFGNAVADFNVGNLVGPPLTVRTNATDTSAVRQNQSTGINSAAISNIYDINKDGRVNATDTSLTRQNQNASLIRFFTAPASLQLALAQEETDAVMSDLSWLDELESSANRKRRSRFLG
jgi:ELWxxDGT repeat protein